MSLTPIDPSEHFYTQYIPNYYTTFATTSSAEPLSVSTTLESMRNRISNVPINYKEKPSKIPIGEFLFDPKELVL